jgi:tetratricopeptide (TPR) repeat protein
MEKLVRDFPDTRDYVTHLVMNYRSYGDYLMNYERHEDACGIQRKMLGLLFRAHEKFPESGGQLSNIAWCYHNIGLSLTELGRLEEAADAFRSSRKYFDQLIAEVPDSLRFKWYLTVLLAECPDATVRDARLAREMLLKIVEESPDTREYWVTLANAEWALGNWKAMEEALLKAKSLADEPVPTAGNMALAMAQWHLGSKDAAVESYQSAVQEMKRLSIRDLDTRRLQKEVRALLAVSE